MVTFWVVLLAISILLFPAQIATYFTTSTIDWVRSVASWVRLKSMMSWTLTWYWIASALSCVLAWTFTRMPLTGGTTIRIPGTTVVTSAMLLAQRSVSSVSP